MATVDDTQWSDGPHLVDEVKREQVIPDRGGWISGPCADQPSGDRAEDLADEIIREVRRALMVYRRGEVDASGARQIMRQMVVSVALRDAEGAAR